MERERPARRVSASDVFWAIVRTRRGRLTACGYLLLAAALGLVLGALHAPQRVVTVAVVCAAAVAMPVLLVSATRSASDRPDGRR